MPKQDNRLKNDDERRGLGEVVYSTDPAAERKQREAEDHRSREVDEASKESFPASDPPEFTGTTADSGE